MRIRPENRPQPLYQILSMDVVLGTLAVGLFSIQLLRVKPLTAWWIVLPLSVWAVYTADHLLDGLKLRGQSRNPRHSYHYKYRKPLLAAVFLTAAVAVGLSLWQFEPAIIAGGMLLGIVILVYFALVFFLPAGSPLLQKELIIAVVYMSGILLAPVVWHRHFPSPTISMIFIVLALLAWIEGVMISWFEYGLDTDDDHPSFTRMTGRKNSRQLTVLLLVAMIILLGVLFFKSIIPLHAAAFAIEMVMSITLLTVILFPGVFSNKGLYRWFGEAVFVLPAFIVLF